MKEFIKKWSNWWIFQPQRKELNDAFEKELNELIEREVALRQTDVVQSDITYSQFQDALKVVNEYKTQLEEHFKSVTIEVDGISKYANFNPETSLYDTYCSVRLLNILRANEERLGIKRDREFKLKDLNGVSMSKFLQCRGAGKKALEELKELCFYSGVKLSI